MMDGDPSKDTLRILLDLDAEASNSPKLPPDFERLIERITLADGESWLANAVTSAPFDRVSMAIDRWIPDQISVEALDKLKGRAKSLIQDSREPLDADAIHRGTLAYLIADAASLAIHGRAISSVESDIKTFLLQSIVPFADETLRALIEAALAA